MPTKRTIFFVDTNIFLHYKFFREIDWNGLFGVTKSVMIIAPVVMRELEKKKFDGKATDKVREIADKVTRSLSELIQPGSFVRTKVAIQFETTEPKDEFEEHNLSKEVQDDHLLASILRFEKETGESVTLITADLPLTVKAYQKGIKFIRVPDDLKRPPEESPEKKIIKKLEAELTELRDNLPKPYIVFGNGLASATVKPLLKASPTDDEMTARIQKDIDFPKLIDLPEEVAGSTMADPVPSKGPFSIQYYNYWQAKRFNEDVGLYRKEKSKFILAVAELERLRSQTFELNFKLAVGGTVPGQNLQLYLEFPVGIRVFRDNSEFAKPEEPVSPMSPPSFYDMHWKTYEEYKPYASMRYPNTFSFGSQYNAVQYEATFPPLSSLMEVTTSNGKDTVRDFGGNIDHGYAKLLKMYVHIQSIPDDGTFLIDCRITASNLPNPINTALTLTIDHS